MQAVFLIFLFIVGACMGSFLCCQARRLHLREENQTRKTSASKTGASTKKSLGHRSVCMHCRARLKWYDNIPIISWLALRGKCRKCGRAIGVAEILSELGLGLAFLAIGTTINVEIATPLEWTIFAATLVLMFVFGFLAIYDGLYGELPVVFLTISIICAIIVLFLKEWSLLEFSSLYLGNFLAPALSVAILGGLYLILYLISKGKWVGDGDWLLGLAMGLALVSPWLSLITLFLSNLLATIVIYPFARKHKNKRIHFGPFMVVGFTIALTCSDFFISML